ncbi:UDP-glucuronosyltransferase [Temnothorax longispinosus]|uniref:UDP-glucuronosyltransferase n=1 Tax=Temnothorax longispinosus TaxID=300112 RepID=A0A4S2KGL0_9HYME|nr:UDP-glucuronosyltransferase [Temnothorax longispinosus]
MKIVDIIGILSLLKIRLSINVYYKNASHLLLSCLLDVYAFIFVVVITVLYIALFILRKLKNLLFGSHTCAKKDNAAMKSKKNK